MFTNKANCTVYEKIIQNRSPAYIRHVFGEHYQENLYAQELSRSLSNTASRNPANQTLFIIPKNSLSGYLPKPDDRILDGISEEASPPDSALTVVNVKDFRYGSEKNQHIEVTAS